MSDLHRFSRGGTKTRLIIEPENSRYKDSVTPHRYNTRLSARFIGEENYNTSIYSNESGDSTSLSVTNMSLRTRMNGGTGTHLNPCSEPCFFTPGKFTKYGGVAILCQQFFSKYHKTINLESDLADVKNLMSEMKANMQAIIKAKAETTKTIEEIDQLFHKLRLQEKEKKEMEKKKKCGSDEDQSSALLEKFYADKTGLPDFALESSGGEIVAIPNTQNYNTDESVTLLGWKICSNTRGPSLIIQPSVMPGQCWAFRGCKGSVVIKLMTEIIITAVTLEHIPKSISPSNEISSAPKDFAVYGVCDRLEINLGKFTYDCNGSPVQTFPITNRENKRFFSFVRFDFLSNNGNPLYTCVYRVRVHGTTKSDSNNGESVNSL